MTNKTTASQPKSIGDDAQFCHYMDENWGEGSDLYRQEFIDFLDNKLRMVADFKNFHRSLCARFGYTHDEEFWWRDLISLEEYIATKLSNTTANMPMYEVVFQAIAAATVVAGNAVAVSVQDFNAALAAKGYEIRAPAAQASATIQAAHPDDTAVQAFADAMKAKMAASRAKGRGGWEECHAEDLRRMLVDHMAKGDPVDVGNFAMMLWNRDENTAAAIQEPVMVAEPVGYAHPISFLNLSMGASSNEWMWAKQDAGMVPLYRAAPMDLAGFFAEAKRLGCKIPADMAEQLAAPMVADPAGVVLPEGWELVRGGSDIQLKRANGRWCGYSMDIDSPAHRMTYEFLDAILKVATVKAVPSEALEVGPFTLEQRMPPKDTQVLIYWPCSDGTFGCAVDEWSDLYEDPIGMGGPTICVGEGWMRHEADVVYWAPIPVVNFAAPLGDKTGGGE